MDKINFIQVDPAKLEVKRTVQKKLINEALKKGNDLKGDKFLELCDWKTVYQQAGIKDDTKQLLDSAGAIQKDREVEMIEVNAGASNMEPLTSGHEATEIDKLADTRLRCYMLIKTLIWEKYEESICGGDVVNSLSEMIDFCIDDLKEEIRIWDVVSINLWDIEEIGRYVAWKDAPCGIGSYVRNLINGHLLTSYETCNALISSLTELRENKPN